MLMLRKTYRKIRDDGFQEGYRHGLDAGQNSILKEKFETSVNIVAGRKFEEGYEAGLKEGQAMAERIPKGSLVFVEGQGDNEIIIAINGRWDHLPDDNQKLTVYYKKNHERFRNL